LALKDFPGQGLLGIFVAYILLSLVVQGVYVTLRKYREKKAGAPA
jgi:hypothetical protein